MIRIKTIVNLTQNVDKTQEIFQITSTGEEHGCLWWNVCWGRVDTADLVEEGMGKLY